VIATTHYYYVIFVGVIVPNSSSYFFWVFFVLFAIRSLRLCCIVATRALDSVFLAVLALNLTLVLTRCVRLYCTLHSVCSVCFVRKIMLMSQC